MKLFKIIGLFICLSSNTAYADWTWINSDPFGGSGIDVELVYPQFQTKQLVFKGSNGQFYYYPWDSSSASITEDAQTLMSLLLTALASGKSINVFHDPGQVSGTYVKFSLVNIRKD